MQDDPRLTGTAGPPEHASPLAGRVSHLAALVLPAAVLSVCGFLRRWVGDDGFINVRVAEQLLAGNGLVFNVGERTEVITSPAWVLVLSVAGALGLRVDDAAWSLSLLLAAAGLVWSGLASVRLWVYPAPEGTRARRGWVVPFGLACYACLPPAWDYATSGLENGLGLAFLGFSYWAVAGCLATEPPRRRQLYATALLLSLSPLVRPDYVLLSGPLLLLVCWRAPGLRPRAAVIGAGLGAGAVYQVFRMGYFASLVPNTALAKEAFDTRWEQGWLYAWNSVGLYWLGVPMLCLVLMLLRRSAARRHAQVFALTLVLSGLLHLLYVVRVGGDFMHGRLLLPGLFAFFSAVPLVRFSSIEAKLPRALRWASACVCVVVCGWCLLCALRLRVPAGNEFEIGDERAWFARLAENENPTRIEHYERMWFHVAARGFAQRLASRCDGAEAAVFRRADGTCVPALLTRGKEGTLKDHPESVLLPLETNAVPEGVDAVVAFPPLGIAGGVLGRRVSLVDYYGLADPVASRLTLRRRGRPGHEKAFGTFWLSGKYAASGSTQDGRVKAARQALGCGPLLELRHATTDPLDTSRFVRNVALAFSLHGLRIPNDPYKARRSFCQKPSNRYTSSPNGQSS